jgi:hypothetical protein
MALTGYGAAFGFGWLLHRQTNLLQAIERCWALNLLVAISLTAGSLAFVGVEPHLTPSADPATRLLTVPPTPPPAGRRPSPPSA